ncbi:MAG: cyclase family protein [Acidobacteriota bacterium]
MIGRGRSPRIAVGLLLAALPAGPASAAKLFSLSLDDVARGRAEVVDLTHDLGPDIPLFPGGVPFGLEPLTTLADGYYMNSFCSGEHTGTHLDAAAHFGEGLPAVDEIPAVRLVSIGIVIDARSKSASNPDYVLTLPDIVQWERENKKIPARALVILNTGWHQRWEHPSRYLNRDQEGTMHFPGFSVEALTYLIQERNVNGVGIDTASIDPGNSPVLEGHKYLLTGGRYAVENLDNLDLLPARGFAVVVGPLKISNGSGAPARVLAIVPR